MVVDVSEQDFFIIGVHMIGWSTGARATDLLASLGVGHPLRFARRSLVVVEQGNERSPRWPLEHVCSDELEKGAVGHISLAVGLLAVLSGYVEVAES